MCVLVFGLEKVWVGEQGRAEDWCVYGSSLCSCLPFRCIENFSQPEAGGQAWIAMHNLKEAKFF